jgi:Fic family protein
MTTMSESQTGSFSSNVEDLALEELGRLDQERMTLQGLLAEVQEQIKEVKAVLKAIHPQQPKQQKKKAGGRTQALSAENRALASEFLRDNENEITARSFSERFGWSQSTANRALIDMRELGFLRLIGRQGQKHVYRSML